MKHLASPCRSTRYLRPSFVLLKSSFFSSTHRTKVGLITENSMGKNDTSHSKWSFTIVNDYRVTVIIAYIWLADNVYTVVEQMSYEKT